MCFKVIIAGSRKLPKEPNILNDIKGVILSIIKDYGESSENIMIISGHAQGADLLGEEIAFEQGYCLETFIPNWEPMEGYPVRYNKYGKPYNPVAGHIRNGLMAECGDILIAIWDGKSKGTEDMIKKMKHLGKTVYVINI